MEKDRAPWRLPWLWGRQLYHAAAILMLPCLHSGKALSEFWNQTEVSQTHMSKLLTFKALFSLNVKKADLTVSSQDLGIIK